jgi:release factor glutamine methyltransferase
LTLHEVLSSARARLVAAGIPQDEASLDVDLYACTILSWDRAKLLADRQSPRPDGLEPQLSEWIARRERHEPTAYIVGVREFWGLDFEATPAVLIPRPETEFLVEEALALVRAGRLGIRVASGSLRVADIGTGSGCVAVALATELRDCRVVASDISAEALVVAKRNATRHGVADRIEFVTTSYLDGIEGPFDLLTANPPYVQDGDRPALGRGVLHEPGVALFGGARGFRDIGGVLDAAAVTLVAGGYLVMEFGYGQEDGVASLVRARDALSLERVRQDLQGIPRTAIIRHR